MENLSLHIEYLLLRHDCVVVPGFGAFIKVKIPARFDDESGNWFPPTHEIRFNASINHEDALLVNSYSRKYSIPFQQARELLAREISRVTEILENDGEATIGNLGILKKRESRILFSPFSSPSKTFASLGFYPVKDSLGELSENTDDKYAIRESSSEPGSGDYAISNPDSDKYYYFKVNKIAAKVAASLLLLAVIAISIFLPSDSTTKVDKASVLPVDTISSKVSSVSESMTASNAEDTSISSYSETETSNVSETINNSEKKYYLIVGTFKYEDEAKKYLEMNSREGYELIILPSKTLYRVYTKTSDDKSDLIKDLNSSEFNKAFPNAWIWKN